MPQQSKYSTDYNRLWFDDRQRLRQRRRIERTSTQKKENKKRLNINIKNIVVNYRRENSLAMRGNYH